MDRQITNLTNQGREELNGQKLEFVRSKLTHQHIFFFIKSNQ